jgi:hypothetical protein
VLPLSELPLVEFGLRCTLSQLLDTGVMHADPHAGNLFKLPPRAPPYSAGPLRLVRRLRLRPRRLPPVVPRLAYLDFGLVSEVPLQVWRRSYLAPNPNPNPNPPPTPTLTPTLTLTLTLAPALALTLTLTLQVREALVCAVAQLVFARDLRAVAALFGELMLPSP